MCEREEFGAVRRVRLATERTVRSPQSRSYGNDGMSLMWIPAHTTVPPFATAPSASGTSAPTGAKMIAASSSSGGVWSVSPAHTAPSSHRELLARGVAGSGDREDAPSLVARHLGNDVSRRAEAVQAKAHAVTRGVERAISDQSRAQQRRRIDVAVRAVDGKAESRVGDRVLGVSAVDVIAGESRAVAQILAPGRAVDAHATRPAEPGNADAIADADRLHRAPISTTSPTI